MIDTTECITQLASHVARLGVCSAVNGHEPKNAPSGPTAAVWVQELRPTTAITAANATSALLVFMVRLYSNMNQEPVDAIDPAMTAAADAIITSVSADFTFGDTVDFVDLLGQTGVALGARAGYVNVGGTMFRAIDITVPIVLIDAWPQAR